MNVGVFLRRRVLGHDVAYAAPLLTDFNPARVMSTLCKVHGHELLKDGLFNGDPHAGNFLLLRDGRIGCIDYGQVKKLTTSERHWLCKVYLALRDDDTERLRALAQEIGMRTRYNLDYTRQKMLTFALDRDGRDVTQVYGKVQGVNKRRHNSASYVQLLHRARELRCCMSQGPLPGLVRSQVRFVWKLHTDVAYTCNWADLFRKYDRDQPHADMLPEANQHESDWTSVHTQNSGQREIIGNLHEAFPDGDMWGGFQFFTRWSLRLALAVEFHASNVDSMDERLVPTLCGEMRWCTAAPFEPADIQTMFHCCPWAYTDPGGVASSCDALRAFQQNVRAAVVDGASTPLGISAVMGAPGLDGAYGDLS